MSIRYGKDNYINVSLNGVEFLLKSIIDNSGDKLIVHELPNQGRVVQFFGKQEAKYTCIGRIDIEGYPGLKSVLDNPKKEKINFQTPFDGEISIYIENIERDTFGAFGHVDFTLTFIVSKISSEFFATNAFKATKLVSNTLKETKIQKFSNFIRTGAFNISKARNKVSSVVSSMQSVLGAFDAIADEVNQVSSTLDGLRNTIVDLINTPDALISTFDSVISDIANVFPEIEDSLSALDGLAQDIGVSPMLETSQYQKEITFFNNLIDSAVSASIIENYGSLLLNKEFVYDNDINNEFTRLDRFLALSNNINDFDIRLEYQNLIDHVRHYLQEKKQFTKNTQTYTTQYPTSDSVICYNIYGNLDNLEQLRNWNSLATHGFVDKGQEIIYYI